MRGILTIDKRIMKMGMADTVRNSFIALPIISLFEVIMIIRWFLSKSSLEDTGSMLYLAGYLALLVCSLAVLVTIFSLRKDVEKKYRLIYLIQALYAVAIVAWASDITYIASRFYDYLDYLVYVTIVIVVPVFCFLSPLHWTPVQLVSYGFVLYLAQSHIGFQGFLINFTVFTIISIVASWTLFRVRFSAYQRQLQLEEERDQTRYHAYHDALTDLPNRRSYIEDLERIERQAENDRLILAVFDVNGLKKVNDTLGHGSGDELIRGAAECIVQAFSGLGTVYRVGGDEFTGILYGTRAELTEALQRFSETEASWAGKEVRQLSVSVGTAVLADDPTLSFKELETMADDAMYAAKQAYYDTLRLRSAQNG